MNVQKQMPTQIAHNYNQGPGEPNIKHFGCPNKNESQILSTNLKKKMSAKYTVKQIWGRSAPPCTSRG